MVLCAVFWCTPTAAQVLASGPPGPYVIDIRGATAGLPSGSEFYPPLGTTAAISSRGFGLEAGGHVYLAVLGMPRLGLGASFVQLRGTSDDATVTLRLIAPQLSFNFGTGNGWSYLSAGLGAGRLETEVASAPPARARTGTLRAINFGGGARWFLGTHLGVGFDVRFHRLAAGQIEGGVTLTPRQTALTAAVGISLK